MVIFINYYTMRLFVFVFIIYFVTTSRSSNPYSYSSIYFFATSSSSRSNPYPSSPSSPPLSYQYNPRDRIYSPRESGRPSSCAFSSSRREQLRNFEPSETLIPHPRPGTLFFIVLFRGIRVGISRVSRGKFAGISLSFKSTY